ncbi:MAG: primosomal protein N' [Actinomycetota bacterium]
MSSAGSAADADLSAAGGTDVHLVARVVPLVPAWSVDRTFDYAVPDDLGSKVTVGSLVRVPFGGRTVRGIVTSLAREHPERELERVRSVQLHAPVAPPPMPELFRWVAERYVVPQAKSFGKAVPPRVRVKELPPGSLRPGHGDPLLATFERGTLLLEAIRTGQGGTWSLRTLPATPRGPLIAELIAQVGEQGSALVLVPEVRFGSLVLDAIAADQPDLVRLDSSEDDMERSQAWMRMATGHALGAGGRAAVFAPAPDLKLIVIDEEHDQTYKEDRSPRYDARRVAIERARLQGAVCVLVSATPSLGLGGDREGAIEKVMPGRTMIRAARPVVELVEVPEQGGLSPELHARARNALREGQSVALLAPATGYARALWCSTCRRSVRCPRCEAGLTYDRKEARVRCPRCRFSAAAPDLCPSCSSSDLRFMGRGTERYAEQLRKAFPRTPLFHMDRAGAESASKRTWEGAGIYLTSWFGTKAELRPPVSLVGVLDADALIRRPDYKAAELAHQALVEMAGWAGPASGGGRLVIQTDEPNHHAVQAVMRGDHDFFARRELEQRRELDYPPFKELVKVSTAGTGAAELADSIAVSLRDLGARVLGPIDAPFPTGSRGEGATGDRLLGRQLLIKCPSAQVVASHLRDILPGVPRGTRLRVDVDPR